MTLSFSLLADTRCRVAEAPVWDNRRELLFFVDIGAPAVLSVRLDGSGLRSWPMPSSVGSIGLAESGALVVALKHEIALLDPESGAIRPFARLSGEPETNRTNDGKVGPDGAFWVGTMDERPEKQPSAALYRITSAGAVERKFEGLVVSNGLAWTPDGRTMFHSDSRGAWIDAHEFDPRTGALSNRRRIAVLDDATGRPDGAACDAEGFYWSAGVSAGRLNRFAPDGRLVESHPVPVPAPTMPCFCGPDLKILVITTLRPSDPEKLARHPQSGGLFWARSTVAGAPVARFRQA